jgi:hypothetical protein
VSRTADWTEAEKCIGCKMVIINSTSKEELRGARCRSLRLARKRLQPSAWDLAVWVLCAKKLDYDILPQYAKISLTIPDRRDSSLGSKSREILILFVEAQPLRHCDGT